MRRWAEWGPIVAGVVFVVSIAAGVRSDPGPPLDVRVRPKVVDGELRIPIPASTFVERQAAWVGVSNRYVMVFGGRVVRSGRVHAPGDGMIYDVAARRWRGVPSPPGLRASLGPVAALATPKHVFVVGAECGDTPYDLEAPELPPCTPGSFRFFSFDIALHGWHELTPPPLRPGAEVQKYIGGFGVVGSTLVLAQSGSPPMAYDVSIDRWSTIPAPPDSGEYFCVGDDHLVEIVDANAGPDDQSPEAARVWNPDSRNWRDPVNASGLVRADAVEAACTADGLLVHARTGERFVRLDPATGTWSPALRPNVLFPEETVRSGALVLFEHGLGYVQRIDGAASQVVVPLRT